MYHFVSAYLCLQWLALYTLGNFMALQNGSGIFIHFIKSWMHWFDHFLTKLSKYLWIKTGDRHYHFVEPWVIDRPFCRMETLYRSHFVEKGVGSLQNGPPQPPPGNGKEDSKCTKHTILGPLLEVEMSKKCTPLWREAHLEVKMYKTHHVQTTFGGWDVEFRKSARRCGAKYISKSKG